MGKNFNGTLINGSQTITEKAGAEIADCRNRIVKYDSNGDVVLSLIHISEPTRPY